MTPTQSDVGIHRFHSGQLVLRNHSILIFLGAPQHLAVNDIALEIDQRNGFFGTGSSDQRYDHLVGDIKTVDKPPLSFLESGGKINQSLRKTIETRIQHNNIAIDLLS